MVRRKEAGEKMNRCEDIELLMQDYLDGYLLPSQREVLDGHIRSCPSCRLLLGGMRRLEAGFDGFPEVDAPADLGDRIVASLPEESRLATFPRRVFAGHPGMMAAAAAILVVGLFLGSRVGLKMQGGYQEVEMVFFAPGVASVAVVGDFNEWDTGKNLMARGDSEGMWRAKLKLPPGVYEYSFLINGKRWASDPGAENSMDDGFGRENSLLFVDG
jgi:hypothetical protein